MNDCQPNEHEWVHASEQVELAHGIFAAQGEAFTHTPASRLLRTDHPQSMRAFARMFGLRAFWETQGP